MSWATDRTARAARLARVHRISGLLGGSRIREKVP